MGIICLIFAHYHNGIEFVKNADSEFIMVMWLSPYYFNCLATTEFAFLVR